jgi:hypothetical protein
MAGLKTNLPYGDGGGGAPEEALLELLGTE